MKIYRVGAKELDKLPCFAWSQITNKFPSVPSPSECLPEIPTSKTSVPYVYYKYVCIRSIEPNFKTQRSLGNVLVCTECLSNTINM